MGKNLAIKGHPTRGEEVIKLLEMMGGDTFNSCMKIAYSNRVYYIGNNNAITWDYIGPEEIDKYEIFTLEEFLEKYPFYVGAGVLDIADGNPGTIGGMKWDEDVSDMKYHVFFDNGDMGWYTNDTIAFLEIDENLGETQSNQDIDKVVDNFRKEFCGLCGSQRCSGQDDELEYCERFKNLIDELKNPSVKNHKMGPKSKLPSKYYEDKLEKTQSAQDKSIFMVEHSMWPIVKDGILEYKIIDGYEVDKIENGNIILKPIKPKYPTTYDECCKVLGCKSNHFFTDFSYNGLNIEISSYEDKIDNLLQIFRKLRYCRDAYWKIAGEEMGLNKPWEPDLENEELYCIQNYNKQITISRTNTAFNKVLIFPTEEMRDAFYENFKDLIEQCKELL